MPNTPTLDAYLPLILRATLAQSPGPAPVLATHYGALLYTDLTGFTALTESLLARGAEGLEDLTHSLNTVFDAMITAIEDAGGDVVLFHGDALTAVFPQDDADGLPGAVRRAWQAAHTLCTTPALAHAQLVPKVALSAGPIEAVLVGGVGGRRRFFIAGPALAEVVALHSGPREIVLTPAAHDLLPDIPFPATHLPRPAADPTALAAFVPREIAHWLAEDLGAWLSVLRPLTVLFVKFDGLPMAPSAELLRVAHALTCDLQTLIDKCSGSLNKLCLDDKGFVGLLLFGAPPLALGDDALRAVQCALDLPALAARHGLRASVGVASGQVFAGAVGGLTRCEYTVLGDTANTAARLMVAASTASPAVSGITSPAVSGTDPHSIPRRIGDTNGILCDAPTCDQTRTRIAYGPPLDLMLKGKRAPVRAHAPTRTSTPAPTPHAPATLVGRTAERAALRTVWESATSHGTAHVAALIADAGLGKSRLLAEVAAWCAPTGVALVRGAGTSVEAQTPYYAWRAVLADFFDLATVAPEAHAAHITTVVTHLAPAESERLPLLNDILALDLPETPFTAALASELRPTNLVHLLRALWLARTQNTPLVTILDDAHWLDRPSWDLCLALAHGLPASARWALFVAWRPLDSAESPQGEHPLAESAAALLRAPNALALTLSALAPDEAHALAAAHLDVPVAHLPAELRDLLDARAAGNPFFIEELLEALLLREALRVSADTATRTVTCAPDFAARAAQLPATIHGLVLARVDALAPDRQVTLRAAAVIGRVFPEAAVQAVLSLYSGVPPQHVATDLHALAANHFTPLESVQPTVHYAFKHILMLEAVYQTLLVSQRRALHAQAVAWYEATIALPARGPYAAMLAHHCRLAGLASQEWFYEQLAGNQAYMRYAYHEANTHLRRALELTAPDEHDARYALLDTCERIASVLGARTQQAADLQALEALALTMDDTARRAYLLLRRAALAGELGQFDAALTALAEADALATAQHDPLLAARVRLVEGMLCNWRGQGDDAVRVLEAALALCTGPDSETLALEIQQVLSDALLGLRGYTRAHEQATTMLAHARTTGNRLREIEALNLLGIIALEQGDVFGGRALHEDCLAACRALGYRKAEGRALVNLANSYFLEGAFEQFSTLCAQAIAIFAQIGSTRGEALVRANRATLLTGLGDLDAARTELTHARAYYTRVGEPVGLGQCETLLGQILLYEARYPEAEVALRAALDTLRPTGDMWMLAPACQFYVVLHLYQGTPWSAQAELAELTEIIERYGISGRRAAALALRACFAAEIGAHAEAQAWAHQAIAAILPGSEQIYETYHLCARAVRATNPAQARAWDAQAYTGLSVLLSSLTPQARALCITHVPEHRAIVAAWEALQGV